MEWKERGWSGKNSHMVEGVVKSVSGEAKYRMKGRFIEGVTILNLCDPNAEEEVVYQMRPRPPNSESMYHFSNFALQLNYLTPELKERLPPTDTRLRPD